MTTKADIIIVGGGPAGLAAGLALGGSKLRRPLDVMIVDAGDPRRLASSQTDSRSSALSRATQAMFQALGLWDQLAPHAQEMRHIIVTDGTGRQDERPALLSFATVEGHRAAAAIAENRHIAKALLDGVDQSPRIKVFSGTKIENLAFGPGFAVVDGAGQQLKAPLLIGADGRNSFARNAAGIGVETHDYGQTALSFSIIHEKPHQARAEEHFSPDGVFAVLPLPGNRASIVWAEPPENARRLMALKDVDFTEEVHKRMGHHLGAIQVDGTRHAFPLSLQLANNSIAKRLALVGDAAHAIHPLAGLGLNLGFKDVAALADCVADAVSHGEDLGGPSVLERYARWRRFDTMATIAAIEGLNRLFSTELTALRALRSFGLQTVDKLEAVKKHIMQEAAGVTGELPRLMRGLVPA